MTWNSTQEIVDGLGLQSAPDDLAKLSQELRRMLGDLHPDKSGGIFESEDLERQYEQVSTARDFVSAQASISRDVIPINQLPALMQVLQQAKTLQSSNQDLKLRREVRDENRQDLNSRYVAPRVGSGVFAAITGALFTFSGSLSDHPVLGALQSSYEIQVGLLAMSIYSAIFFGLTWYFERRAEAKVDFLLSEEGMRLVFDGLMHSFEGATVASRFSTRDVSAIVSKYFGDSRSIIPVPTLIGRQRVKPSTVDRIVQLHIAEWKDRGVVRELQKPSLERLYEFDSQVVEKHGSDLRSSR